MRLLFPGLVALTVVACSEPEESSSAKQPPPPCNVDGDCGPGRYCAESGICRRDCYVDAHCFGPSTTAQCNSQGKCIETVDAAMPPVDDAEPSDGGAEPETSEEEGGGA